MLVAFVLAAAAPADAALQSRIVGKQAVGADVDRYTLRYGPLTAAPGQNAILLGPLALEKPSLNGYLVRIKPDLVRRDGTVPAVEQIHMHHAVLLNFSQTDATANLPERFYGFGEEKTIVDFAGTDFGYPVRRSDVWGINHMLHNGTPQAEEVFVEFELDIVRSDTPRGRTLKPARPLWMDVVNGSAYPVFDVKRFSGGLDGRFTYPDDLPASPYRGRALNEWPVDRDLVLLGTAGHVHPGGLWTDLAVERAGQRRRIFRSEARYFDPNGPVSWDMAMTRSPPDWNVAVRKGDVLRVNATYETDRASWYEAMGIMVVYAGDGTAGRDPFRTGVPTRGEPTHGHLPEASNYGGEPTGLPDAATLADGAAPGNYVGIAAFANAPGDLSLGGAAGRPPAIDPGDSLRFKNADAAANIFHTVTACRAPCNRSTGISYPLADGEGDFDSAELGYGPTGFTAAANRDEWATPADLEPGTYTYFCRVHPSMRGAFRVRGTPPRRKVTLRQRRVRVGRNGKLAVRAACEGSRQGACQGGVRLVRGKRTLASGKLLIAAGGSQIVRMRLNAVGRRAVRRARPRRSVAARLVVAAEGGREAFPIKLVRGRR